MINPRLSNTLQDLMAQFTRQFFLDLETAVGSGAVPDYVSDAALGKVVLQLTAKKFFPLAKEHKDLLRNLENFI